MLAKNLRFAGIDYGSKLAGTTVIAFLNTQNEIEFAANKKNQDADLFILEWCKNYSPTYLFIDAPLSLPGVYQNLADYKDYFYREADRAARAMSPLFLGGLTARAMKLKADLQNIEIQTLEVYPGYLAKVLQLDKAVYKKEKDQIPILLDYLSKLIDYPIAPPSNFTWHHFDAILAFFSGIRYINHQYLIFGNLREGQIIV